MQLSCQILTGVLLHTDPYEQRKSINHLAKLFMTPRE